MGYSLGAVGRDIADRDAFSSGSLKVKIVIAGSCLTDQFDGIRETINELTAYGHFLCYNNGRPIDPF